MRRLAPCTKTCKFYDLYENVQVFVFVQFRTSLICRRSNASRTCAAPRKTLRPASAAPRFLNTAPAISADLAGLPEEQCRSPEDRLLSGRSDRPRATRRRWPAPGACLARRKGRPPDRTYFLP